MRQETRCADIVEATKDSWKTNKAHLVGLEDGSNASPVYAWTGFLEPESRKLKDISKQRLFYFSHTKKGTVTCTQDIPKLRWTLGH